MINAPLKASRLINIPLLYINKVGITNLAVGLVMFMVMSHFIIITRHGFDFEPTYQNFVSLS